MRVPHSLLIGLAAAVLWGASRLAAPPMPKRSEDIPALAISGSSFGSLAARTMRGSLYSYWHSGEAYHAPEKTTPQQPTANTPPPPPPPTPGVFSRRRLGSQPPADSAAAADQAAATPPAPAPESRVIATGPPLDRAAAWLNGLEKRRTQRRDRSPLSGKHIQYLNAATGWRLRLAYNLDPGDPILYEILHHHILTTSQDINQARARSRSLTDQALAHAHSSQAGMADALTGVGAAINALDELILSAKPNLPGKDQLLASWQEISSSQTRFREFRADAEREGWWSNIPDSRRTEIDSYASFLNRLTGQIREFLTKNGVLAVSPQ
jgi:hypothetical protein